MSMTLQQKAKCMVLYVNTAMLCTCEVSSKAVQHKTWNLGIVIMALTCTAGYLDLTWQALKWFNCSSFQFFPQSIGSLLTTYTRVYTRLYDVSHFSYLRMFRITAECIAVLVTLHVELPCKLVDHMDNTFLIHHLHHHELCLHFDYSLFVCALLPVKLN